MHIPTTTNYKDAHLASHFLRSVSLTNTFSPIRFLPSIYHSEDIPILSICPSSSVDKFLSIPPDIMDFPRDPPKLKSLTSLFFGKKEKRQAMQSPPPPPLEPGLKTLTTTLAANHNPSLSCKKPSILSFSSTANPSSSSSSSLSSLASPPSTSPSTSSSMDDVEDHSEEEAVACHAAKANADGIHDDRKKEEEEEEAPQMQSSLRRRWRLSSQKEREFPPPIPHLARTGNLPCHMPWVLKRSYIDNGRLVIREVKVKHHEYFRAHRANGRLTLQIMQLADSAASLPWRSPANSTDSPEITDKTDRNSPLSSLSSSASVSSSSSAPSSPSAEEDDDECGNIVKINAGAGGSNNPPPFLSPSSLPTPPSTFSKELKSILEVNRGCSCQGRCSINGDDTIGDTRDVMEMGTLPSILSSSMPESSFGIGGGGSSGGGGGGCCCLNKRSNSLFSTPIPTIRPVHS